FITNDDTSVTVTNNSLARRSTGGILFVETTPSTGNAATSKTYVDTNAAKNGYVTSGLFAATTGTTTGSLIIDCGFN
ncbi:hypothetical protein M3M33_17570, partial [Loigolactobacillus coryniformis]|uniref:hypothetical protein n=1 Tax=Loigolactobacillus coryniformis TaxID=1610 RepID=UPI00201A40BB